MPLEMTLSLRDRYRSHSQEVAVNALRFTIGSAEDDDLTLADAPLAPHQIVLKTFGEAVWLEDTGTTSDITINDLPLTGSRKLEDQDVIGLAGVYELIVHRPPHRPINTTPAIAAALAAKPAAQREPSASFSPPLVERRSSFRTALLAMGLLALTLTLAVVFAQKRKPDDGPPAEITPSPTRMAEIRFVPLPDGDRQTGQVLTAIRQVLKCSCDGDAGDYVFPGPVMQRAVEDRVQRYGSTERDRVARALQSVRAQSQKIIEQAPQTNLKKHPALIVYLVLAELLANPISNPVEVARQTAQGLNDRRDRFGGENGDDVLLAVATQKTGNWIGLWSRLGQLNPRTERNAWHLYQEKKWLGEPAYQFLLDFLALSVIAQEPSRWGINAPALKVCGPE